MKKQIILATVITLFSFTAVSAQGGGGQRKTPEERAKEVMAKMADFKLDTEKSASVESIFSSFYKAQQQKMEEMRAAGGAPDRDAMMAARKKLADERDASLEKVLTADQFKKWRDEIEPTTRPQRPAGQRA